MEKYICKVHNQDKEMYCTDCKEAVCEKCEIGKWCRPDHKKVGLKEWMNANIEIKRQAVNESMKLVSEIAMAEQSVEQGVNKLQKLFTKEYQEVFTGLKVIHDKIEEILEAQKRLPLEAQKSVEIISKVKAEAIDLLVDSKTDLKESEKQIQKREFSEIVMEEPKEIHVIHTKIYEQCLTLKELEGKVAEFFRVLKTFMKELNCISFSTVKSENQTVTEGTQTVFLKDVIKDICAKHRKDELVTERSVKRRVVSTKKSLNKTTTYDSPSPSKTLPLSLELCFASFLNLENVAETIRVSECNQKISVFGLKTSFGTNEITSFIQKLDEDLRLQIRSVTFEHMYFKDLSAFVYLFQEAKNMTKLQLLSCPFTGLQILYVLEKVAEYGQEVQTLVIENSALSEQNAKDFVLGINKTSVNELKLVIQKGSVEPYVRNFIDNPNDKLKVIDFGKIKTDARSLDMLKALADTKRVCYSLIEQ